MRFILLLALFNIALFGQDSVGIVTGIEGRATASLNEAVRVLKKGSDIFVNELITLEALAKAQIRFKDGSLINLIPNSQFRVNSYQYKKIFQKDAASSDLLRGGFRLLSGSIAKKNPSGYEIKTPSATIGLRGTIIEAVLLGQRLTVGVTQGVVEVSNQAGSALIGQGQPNSFVTVPGDNVPPILLLERPAELELSYFTPPANTSTIEEIQAERKGTRKKPTQRGGTTEEGTTSSTTDEGTTTSTTEETTQGEESLLESGGGASITGGC